MLFGPKALVCLFSFLIIISCDSKVRRLSIDDNELKLEDSIMLYKKKPYTGILFSKVDTTTTYSVTYVKGKKEGKEQQFYLNGDLAVERFYTQGKKSGTHRAWWNNKQPKFIHHYDNIGNFVGAQREWYSNGQMNKEFNYREGQEEGTQKLWDVDGKIIANYQVRNGEKFGLIGSEFCKSGAYED